MAGFVLLIGVDHFLSEARAVTMLIGNGVTTLLTPRWEGGLDRERRSEALDPAAPSRPRLLR